MVEIEGIFDCIVVCGIEVEVVVDWNEDGLVCWFFQVWIVYNDESVKLFCVVKVDECLKKNFVIVVQFDVYISQMCVQMGWMQVKWWMYEIEVNFVVYLVQIKEVNCNIVMICDWVCVMLSLIC